MKLTILLVGAFMMLIPLWSSAALVQAQPTTQPAVPPTPRITLTAEQE